MKKTLLLITIFTVLISLTGCVRHGDPAIIKDYELEEVSFEKASMFEWQLEPIDEEYGYVSDYFHDDRDGYFLRIYHGEELVYEELSDEYYYSVEATRINNSFYLYYNTVNDEFISQHYIVRLDENFHKEILVQESDWSIVNCLFNETCITYLKTNRKEDISTLVELDYQGQIIKSKDFDKEFTRLFEDNGVYYLKKENQIYYFDFTNGIRLYDEMDVSQLSAIKIQNGFIYYVDYHHDDESCEIHYHNGKEDRIILKIPKYDEENLYYDCEEAMMVNEDVFIPVHVGVAASMSIYSRMLVFHYDGETQQVKLIYLNKNCNKSLVGRNKMFIGYYHSGDYDGMNDGTFYGFNLEESASRLW